MELVIVIALLLGLVGYYVYTNIQVQKRKRARTAVERGDLDTALTIFMESLRRDPNDVDAIWHLGNINEEKGQFPEAIGYYDRLLSLNKESKLFTPFQLYRRIGLLYQKMAMDREALDNFLQAHEIIPSAKDVIKEISMTVYGQGLFSRAIPYFEKAYQLIKGDAQFLKHYGLCLLMLDKYSDALTILAEAKAVDANDAEIRFLLAYGYIKSNSYGPAVENMEYAVNAPNYTLSQPQTFYALKVLYLGYLLQKNFEITKDLVAKLKEVADKSSNITFKNEANVAYVLFRIKQGYFENALDEMNRNQAILAAVESVVSDGSITDSPIRDNRSNTLYKLIQNMMEAKKENDKLLLSTGPHRGPRFEFDQSLVEKKIRESQEAVDMLFDNWKMRFVDKNSLWDFVGPKPRSLFDPTLVLDKYKDEALRVLKENKADLDKFEEEVKLNKQNPCAMLKEVDFPTFSVICRQLAEAMGYKVINQVLKIDKMAYAEKKGVDMLCTEKYNPNVRVVFSVRRFDDPIGNITMTDLLSSLRNFQAVRLILVSQSPLTQEAKLAIDGRSVADFYTCEEVNAYLIDAVKEL